MKPLVFKNKIKNRLILDMSWISNIDTSDIPEIKNKNIQMGNKSFKVSELFQVTGEDCNNIKIFRSNSCLVNIGNNLKDKTLFIEGDAGIGLARNMNSGTVILKGNASEAACSGMKGGSVYIYGNAGNRLCCLPTGKNEGILDGFIYVQKNVGSDSIARMRRGNIVIGGNIGSNSCYELISGSITVLGKIGKSFCVNAKRGTIFAKDSSIAKNYIKANNTDLTFYNFYRININKMTNKKLIKSICPQRYFGTKKERKLVELFVI
jgi:formylmethanofuran dehydrogenase subunit C